MVATFTTFTTPTVLNRPAVIAPAPTVGRRTVNGASASRPQVFSTQTLPGRHIASQPVARTERLRALSTRFLAGTVATGIFAGALFVGGHQVQALAPLSFTLASLGSLLVLR